MLIRIGEDNKPYNGRSYFMDVRTKDILKINLEYMRDLAERPLYNHLEAGFRHHPLSVKEQFERYKDCTDQIFQICGILLNEIK